MWWYLLYETISSNCGPVWIAGDFSVAVSNYLEYSIVLIADRLLRQSRQDSGFMYSFSCLFSMRMFRNGKGFSWNGSHCSTLFVRISLFGRCKKVKSLSSVWQITVDHALFRVIGFWHALFFSRVFAVHFVFEHEVLCALGTEEDHRRGIFLR